MSKVSKVDIKFFNEFLPQLYAELAQFYTGIVDPKQPRENWRNEIPPHPQVAKFLINFAKDFGINQCKCQEISFLEALFKKIAVHYYPWFIKLDPTNTPDKLLEKMDFWTDRKLNNSYQKYRQSSIIIKEIQIDIFRFRHYM